VVRLALGIEYCGCNYEGWQSQPHGRTVQNVLESAIRQIAAEPVAVTCAGRTDTGVHASAQVVHFDTSAIRPQNAWVRGVNTYLPEGVAVTWACEVDGRFHARFSAITRRYRYVLLNRPVRSALLHGRVGWYHSPLDASLMQQAADLLVGVHDFSAFRAAQCQAKTPVRDLRVAQVTRAGDWVVFDFEANAFLHHMIRNLVGALIYVGNGNHPPSWFEDLLNMRDRRLSPPTFSPDGLYLCGVEYPNDWNLPGRGRIIAPLFLPAGFA
jgi:tRNA pseudouridine38-40 synthase